MKKIHYYSGLFIAIFIAFHLINHTFAIVGLEKHLAVMKILRLVYRNLLVESLLLIAVLVQIYSGIKLLIQKRKLVVTVFEKLQIYSGLYMAIFLSIHVSAVLAARFIFKMDSNTYFGAATLNHFPEILFFVPYYFFAIIAFFIHVSSIHFLYTNSKIQSYSIIIFGFIWALFIILALTNCFHFFSIPADYTKMLF
jgi:hypothetical protein